MNAVARKSQTRVVPDGYGVVVVVHNEHRPPPDTRAFRYAFEAEYWIELENLANGKNERLMGYMVDETHRLYAGAVPAGTYRNISVGRLADTPESLITVEAGTISDEGTVVFMLNSKGTATDVHWRANEPTLTRMRLADYAPGLAVGDLPIRSAAGTMGPRTRAAYVASEYLSAILMDRTVYIGSSAGMLFSWSIGSDQIEVIDTGLTAPLDILERFPDGTLLVGGGFMQMAKRASGADSSWQSATSGLGGGRTLSAKLMPDGFVYLLHREGKELVLYRATDSSARWQEVLRQPATEAWQGNQLQRFQPSSLYVAGDELLFPTAKKTLGAYNTRSGTFEARALPGQPLSFIGRNNGPLMALVGFVAFWHESTDHGRNWRKLPRDDETASANLAMKVDNTLIRYDFVPGTSQIQGLARSVDQGKSWQTALSGGFPVRQILNPPSSSLVIVIGDVGQLHFSEDAGEHWREVGVQRTLR
ncbi:hypothetical protein C7S18_19865 [Ahniella affigens]|uniref:Photosynthesis system II assembly factor Ycf48/Hcf136-like domain-containing protein n=1 Tax=Ahniella affigens TaxID=2021234 RepID=A0A2P1PWV3_9GAMM|nr:hypothetical protein [Ahniella affigens]AVP99284.1 hypothetical protein C7S18_19865 [Ahniella affigens]